MAHATKNAVIYTRTASESGGNTEAQVANCKQYAASNGYDVLSVFSDQGKSGASSVGRDAFSKALQFLEEKKVNALIVHDIDRLARSESDYFLIRSFLKKNGVLLISANQPNMEDTPEGKLLDIIMAGVNEFQSKLHGQRVREGLRHSKMQSRND